MSALGRYRKNLRPDTRTEPPSPPTVDTYISDLIEEIRAEEGATTKVPPHPSKYPDHKDREKGSVFGGICNRTACNDFPALFYNKGTFGYYCVPCGRAINGRDLKPLCERVDHDLSHEEMNERYRL